MTQKQKELFDFIVKFTRENGYPPSYDQMLEALSLKSKSGIHRMVEGLEERGYIRREAGRARTIEIIRTPESAAPDPFAIAMRILPDDVYRGALSYCADHEISPRTAITEACRAYFLGE